MESRKLVNAFVCVVLLLSVLLAGCAQPTPTPTPKPAPTKAAPTAVPPTAAPTAVPATATPAPAKLNVAYLPNQSFAPLFVALERGYFKEQGLELNMQRVASGSEAMAFLASGQMDFAGSAIVGSTFNAIARGFDLRVVGAGAIAPMSGGPNAILVRKDLWDSGAVKKPADLKGKKVAVSGGAGSGGAFSVAVAIQGTGVTVKDIEWVNLANPDMAQAMAQKSIDACYVGSPHVTNILKAGTGVVLAADLTGGQMVIIWLMSGKLLRENPSAATRMMVGLVKAARDMQDDKYFDKANMDAYVKWTGAKEEDIRATSRFIYSPNVGLQSQDLVFAEKVNREAGWTDYKDALDVSKMVDETPLKSALKTLGEVPFAIPTAVPPTAVPTPATLTVAYLPIMHFAPLYIALEKGYFAQQGLTIKMERVASGSEAMAFLASGQMDVAGSSLVASSFTSINRGMDLRIVCSAALQPMKDSPNVIIVRKDLWDAGTVKKMADLKGMKVAVSGGAGSGGGYQVAKALDGTGVTMKDIQLVNLGNPDMALGMQQKSIDACMVGTPYSTQILTAGTGVILAKDYLPGAMTTVWMMSGKLLRDKPDVAARFLAAMIQGSRDMQGDKYLGAANMAAYVKWTGGKEADIKTTVPMIYDPNLRLYNDSLKEAERLNREAGWTDYKDALDTAKMVDETPLKAAWKLVGEVPFTLPK